MAYDFGDWPAEIEAVSSLPDFQNATVRLLRPGTGGSYNIETGVWTGGAPTTLVETRARVIGIRSPRDVSGAATANPTNSLSIRVQFPFAAYPSRVPPGTLVRVTDGGRNAALLGYVFVVESDNMNSNRASHTLECTVDLEAVAGWS